MALACHVTRLACGTGQCRCVTTVSNGSPQTALHAQLCSRSHSLCRVTLTGQDVGCGVMDRLSHKSAAWGCSEEEEDMAEVQQLMRRVFAHKKAAARKKEAAIIQVSRTCSV